MRMPAAAVREINGTALAGDIAVFLCS